MGGVDRPGSLHRLGGSAKLGSGLSRKVGGGGWRYSGGHSIRRKEQHVPRGTDQRQVLMRSTSELSGFVLVN